MAKRYNITAPRKYIKDGEEKTAWAPIGRLIYFEATADKEEGFKLELNMFPDTKFSIFPENEREVQPASQPVEQTAGYEYPEEEITPDDNPF